MSFEEVRAAALALPEDDRMRLADELMENVGEEECPLSPAQIEELDRRWKTHLENPGLAIPGDEVLRRLEAKYGR